MAKRNPPLNAIEAARVLENASNEVFLAIQQARSPSCVVDGSADEIEVALRSAACLARDLSELTVILLGAIRHAQTRERLDRLEKGKP